jgi:hypothetical protein
MIERSQNPAERSPAAHQPHAGPSRGKDRLATFAESSPTEWGLWKGGTGSEQIKSLENGGLTPENPISDELVVHRQWLDG